jgi:DtxR family transcriptional regulator, Mn-dependent transcriptional regulator
MEARIVLGTPSAAEQDYLKQIYLQHEEGGRATTQDLAARLGVKPPSVTAMLKHLADDPEGPYVRYTPYHGVELTDKGLAVALEMLRHHRLLELFLAELVGVPWDQVHRDAERLEHVLSEELEDRIAAKLGDPTHDPHGDPIPSRDGSIPERAVRGLCDLAPGEAGHVARITLQDEPVLQYLADLGIQPGIQVAVEAVAPFGGVVTLRVGADQPVTHTIGESLAGHILVTPRAPACPEDSGRESEG